MTNRLIVACIFILASCFSATRTQQESPEAKLTDTFWCHLYGPWEADPKAIAEELGYQGYYTRARVICFCPSGKLEMYGAGLDKIDDIIALGPGDGLTYYLGNWKIEGNKLLLEYRLKWDTLPAIGEENKEHPLIRAEVPFNGKSFVLEGKSFAPLKNLAEETIIEHFPCAMGMGEETGQTEKPKAEQGPNGSKQENANESSPAK